MVNTVHPRRDQDQVEQPLNPNRQADVAVVKQRVGLKQQFVTQKHPRRQTDETDLYHTEPGRERHLSKMEPEGRRDVEIGVDVMDVMKSP